MKVLWINYKKNENRKSFTKYMIVAPGGAIPVTNQLEDIDYWEEMRYF